MGGESSGVFFTFGYLDRKCSSSSIGFGIDKGGYFVCDFAVYMCVNCQSSKKSMEYNDVHDGFEWMHMLGGTHL